MWGLSRSTHGNVAHGDDRKTIGVLLEYAHFKESIAKAHSQPIEPAQRQQPFVDFDEVPFHFLLLIVQYDIGHTCLDGILRLDTAQNTERLIEVAQNLAHLVVEV